MAPEPKQVQCHQRGESLPCTWEAGKPRKETPGTRKGQYTIYHLSKPISLFLVSPPRGNSVLNSVARKVLLKPSSSHIALLFKSPDAAWSSGSKSENQPPHSDQLGPGEPDRQPPIASETSSPTTPWFTPLQGN